MKGVNIFCFGFEYKVILQFVLCVGYNYILVIFYGDVFKDLFYYFIQIDIDWVNMKVLSNYILGIGYCGFVFYVDLVYKFFIYNEDFYLFVNKYEENNVIMVLILEIIKVINICS